MHFVQNTNTGAFDANGIETPEAWKRLGAEMRASYVPRENGGYAWGVDIFDGGVYMQTTDCGVARSEHGARRAIENEILRWV